MQRSEAFKTPLCPAEIENSRGLFRVSAESENGPEMNRRKNFPEIATRSGEEF
jgi:hypothetical protein